MVVQTSPGIKVATIIIVLFIVSLAAYFLIIEKPLPENREDFVAQWRNASDDERQSLLRWLLNEEADRSKVYEVEESKLSGLSMRDVDELMGPPDRYWDGQSTMYRNYLYDLGAIGKWADPIGYNIVGWSDYLKISFDENDQVVYIEIIS